MDKRIGAAFLAAAAALGLAGCVTDDYGYGGVSLGYNGGYYGDPYWGWYDNYYYPGTGYYIYDRGGTRHAWNDSQRRYWEGRRGNRQATENWSGYRNGSNPDMGHSWQQRRDEWRAQNQGLSDEARQQRREAWQARRQEQGASGQTWQQRREAWRMQNQSPGQSQGVTRGWSGRANQNGRPGWHRGD
jgi:hypothetical protein